VVAQPRDISGEKMRGTRRPLLIQRIRSKNYGCNTRACREDNYIIKQTTRLFERYLSKKITMTKRCS
jgi:hypothetical protein